jgi:hypothetical protein
MGAFFKQDYLFSMMTDVVQHGLAKNKKSNR